MSATVAAYAEPRFAPLPPKGKPGRGGIDWKAIGAQLEANPRKWAAIGTVTGTASLGNRGVRLRDRGIETTLRSNGDGTQTIWACYVGPSRTTPPAQRTRHHGPTRRHGDPLDRALGTPAPSATVAPLIWQEAS